MSGSSQLKVLLAAITLVFVMSCHQFNEYDCANISVAVIAGLENDAGLTSGELKLATHLYEVVPAKGSFMVHSYDEVFRACQKFKYAPDSPF